MPFTVNMPKLSPTMEIGTIVKWHKKEGEWVESGELLLEISTDKATVEHLALDPGWLRKILLSEGQAAKINQPLALFSEQENEPLPEILRAVKEEASAEQPPVVKAQPTSLSPEPIFSMGEPAFIPEEPLLQYEFTLPTEELHGRLKVSPLAKKRAKEEGLDLTTVKGSGPGGRIVAADLERAQKKGVAVFGQREIPSFKPGSYEEESLPPIRKVVSQRLQEAKTFIPHFYVSQIIDAAPLHALREQLKEMGIAISYNDCVIRACALALKTHPEINSGFHSVHKTIVRFKTVDISVAVNTAEGLITPIIRHADYKNVGQISVEMRSLAKKAREGKLALEEFKGGSFTISNLGMYGITEFQAIINPPQAAILAVGGVEDVPVIKRGAVVPGKTMKLNLSSDHRVVDGVSAAEFMKTVQKYLENPGILLV